MESFWGSLKNPLVHHHRYPTRAAAQAAIQEYIESFINVSALTPALAKFRQRFLLNSAANNAGRVKQAYPL